MLLIPLFHLRAAPFGDVRVQLQFLLCGAQLASMLQKLPRYLRVLTLRVEWPLWFGPKLVDAWSVRLTPWLGP